MKTWIMSLPCLQNLFAEHRSLVGIEVKQSEDGSKLGIVDKIRFHCGTILDGQIDFYSLWNQVYWELIDLLGFRLMVGPNFSDIFLFKFPWYKKNTQN